MYVVNSLIEHSSCEYFQYRSCIKKTGLMVYQNHCIVKGEVFSGAFKILQMPLSYAQYQFALPIIVQGVMGWTI